MANQLINGKYAIDDDEYEIYTELSEEGETINSTNDGDYITDNNGNSVKYKDDTAIWEYYDYTNNSFENHVYKNINGTNGMGFISQITSYAMNLSKDNNTMAKEWIDFGSSYSKMIKANWNVDVSSDNVMASKEFWTSLGPSLGKVALSTLESAARGVGLAASQAANQIIQNGDSYMKVAEDKIAEIFGADYSAMQSLLDTVSENLGRDSKIMSAIQKGIQAFSKNALNSYVDGIQETSFGNLMESTWSKSASSGMLALVGSKIEISETTPLDSGSDMSNLYGNMILAVPPMFTNITDPRNRTLTNTYMRDLRFVSITPGFAQYNGSNTLLATNYDQFHQTRDPQSQLQYLLKNGLDESMLNKDKRYYTFKQDYANYYSYVETLQNALYIKMGLAENNQKYTIFSYFDNPASTDQKLKPQYNSPIGYATAEVSVSEAFQNDSTSIGGTYASNVNDAADQWQHLNYLTGMGTGGKLANGRARAARASAFLKNASQYVTQVASNTMAALSSREGMISKVVRIATGAASDIMNFNVNNDAGADFQQLSTTNGMKIVYPELWSSSAYQHTCNVTVRFTSPYGDPESIFHYVMAPLATIMCFAMPRQADANGFVSPFFVRADVPGLFTSDFAMISDITLTRGGDPNLWTKDGLPRAIDVNFTITDLYPYLAMTKRLSFLSANPSYTTWIDSLAGLHAINTNETDNALNDYWKATLNRVSGGESISNGLYNRYNTNEQASHNEYATTYRTSRIGNKSKTNKSVSPWLRGI